MSHSLLCIVSQQYLGFNHAIPCEHGDSVIGVPLYNVSRPVQTKRQLRADIEQQPTQVAIHAMYIGCLQYVLFGSFIKRKLYVHNFLSSYMEFRIQSKEIYSYTRKEMKNKYTWHAEVIKTF